MSNPINIILETKIYLWAAILLDNVMKKKKHGQHKWIFRTRTVIYGFVYRRSSPYNYNQKLFEVEMNEYIFFFGGGVTEALSYNVLACMGYLKNQQMWCLNELIIWNNYYVFI